MSQRPHVVLTPIYHIKKVREEIISLQYQSLNLTHGGGLEGS